MMLVFILGFFSINANAKNCVEIPSDQLDDAGMSEVSVEMVLENGGKPVMKPINGVLHKVWIENGQLKCTKYVVSQNMKDSNGKPIMITKDNFTTGADAANSEKESKNYAGALWNGGTEADYAPEWVVGDPVYDPNTNTTTTPITYSQDISKLDPGNGKQYQLCDKMLKVNSDDLNAIKEVLIKEGNRNSEAEDINKQALDWQKKLKNGEVKAHKEKLEKARTMGLATRQTHPPQQICDEDTPDGERACAIWNKIPQPAPVHCDDGPHQGVRVVCEVSSEKEPKSSYTTSTPDNSDPYIKDQSPICNDQREGMLMFSQIMNPFGDRTFSNSDILNNGINNYNKKKPMDKFDNNYWKTSYRGDGREIRKWNPFKDGNRLSGIPYKVFWTKKFDGWYDQSYNINPMIIESINHVKEMECKNKTIASEYNQNGNKFNIFLKAPNNKMKVTALNLDTNTWDSADTGNLYCNEQYMLKIEPRYNLERYTIYQKYERHKTQGKSYTYKCVKTDECKRWSRRCIDRDYKTHKCLDWEGYCAAYYTEGKEVSLGGVDTKYPDGQSTEGPSPAGSIPPVYKQRRKYQYRTGALVEYHAMTRPYGKTTMIPVPNSKDTSKMKSGYGFGYTSGVQMITDYDRAPSTYKFNPVIIRPNKATNLNIRTNNYKSSYGLFDSNVHYDKAKNAPERSSSIDKTFIEETLRGGLTKTTFKPSTISNVEKVDGKAKDFTDVEAMPVKSSMVRKTAVKWGEMTSTFKISSNPAKYYHAYWKTKGEPNLIPAYKPGPLHYVYLDYPSGSDYTVASLDTINLNGKGFFATGMNTGSIKIVGNMWEDSFSRPNFKK